MLPPPPEKKHYNPIPLICACSGPDQPRGPPSGDSADREAYRRGPAPGMEPKGGAGADFRPEFVSFVLFDLQFCKILKMRCVCTGHLNENKPQNVEMKGFKTFWNQSTFKSNMLTHSES